MIFELYIKQEVWMEKKEKVGTGNYHELVLSNSELEASTGLKAVQIIAWMSSVLVIACDHPASSYDFSVTGSDCTGSTVTTSIA